MIQVSAEDGSSTVLSLTLVEQHRKSSGGRWPDSLLTPEGGALWPLEKLWTDHEGNWSRTVEVDDGTKGLFWCEERSVTSAPSRCCYWTDTVTRPRLETGTVCRWGRHTVHTLSAESGGTGWRRGKGAGRQVSLKWIVSAFKISRGKKLHFTSF